MYHVIKQDMKFKSTVFNCVYTNLIWAQVICVTKIYLAAFYSSSTIRFFIENEKKNKEK